MGSCSVLPTATATCYMYACTTVQGFVKARVCMCACVCVGVCRAAFALVSTGRVGEGNESVLYPAHGHGVRGLEVRELEHHGQLFRLAHSHRHLLYVRMHDGAGFRESPSVYVRVRVCGCVSCGVRASQYW